MKKMKKRKLVVLDYGSGNIGSLVNMFRHIGADPLIVSQPERIPVDSAIILPGVGHFSHAAGNLQNTGFSQAILEQSAIGTPILGICVGMQLLFEHSEEGGAKGLGLLKGRIRLFDKSRFEENLPLPNVGWHYAEPCNDTGIELLSNMPRRPKFYYVHNYHAECFNPEDEIITSEYGYRFTGGVSNDNITGFQFHPEKSHVFGMNLLTNWMERVDA